MAAAAPALKAAGTNSWPSRASLRATNTSPGTRLRVSMENPLMVSDGTPSASPCAAATSSAHCHSGSCIDRGLRQRGAHRLVVRERQDCGADDLAGLMALAGDEQHVAIAEQANAGANGFGTVADLARAGRGGEDLGADGGGLLAPGIVVRDDDVVRMLAGDAAHDRALALVSIAAAAEH